ncbi:DUF3017 domain-containing protein [Streptomyces paludis]|uniref:DUF3017 domain-containing protein n=1 Tax=Streptomyces paludis TaxID=2282738 RepID=A0A345HSY1_9ACTN|nr:DUF3017 domain-containing protein [Streptomyces paludis]AXG79805.1 DUF3017 domain-containing protein [Streptomyces paludis]
MGAGTSEGGAAGPAEQPREPAEDPVRNDGSGGSAGAPAETDKTAEAAEAAGTDEAAGATEANEGAGATPVPVSEPVPVSVPARADTGQGQGAGSGAGSGDDPGSRFSLTQDTARPEGGGRAAPRDAAAPVRQWPLLAVLGTTGLGLLIVGLHPFAEAVRIGTILIGVALIGGAVLRRVLPSVGMLAVRSRFTDMLTYGLLGVTIVLLSLMTQPKPWLEIPFLEDIVHSTVP